MDPVDLLRELGGAARRSALLRVVTRPELERAVAAGLVVRDGRGVYVLPDVDAGVRAAVALGGVLGLTSAALRHGWAVARVPELPHVFVGRGRRLPDDARSRANIHVAELAKTDVCDGITTPEVTLCTVCGSCPTPKRWRSRTPRCARVSAGQHWGRSRTPSAVGAPRR